ncbi:hypothetical protein TNCV_3224491 [Trichonephila clavipes]|nr:hypothetical protein TNCV_3224491 [Trichonephila clavipes]
MDAPSTSAIVEHRQYPKSGMVWGEICASGKTTWFLWKRALKSIKKCTRGTLLKMLYFRRTKSISEMQIGRINKTAPVCKAKKTQEQDEFSRHDII